MLARLDQAQLVVAVAKFKSREEGPTNRISGKSDEYRLVALRGEDTSWPPCAG